MGKPRLAIKFTCEDWEKAYLWSFTFPDYCPAEDIFRRWRAIYRVLSPSWETTGGYWDKPVWRGVRVCEWHPGGHGIHMHVGTPDRQDVVKVRQLCWKNDGKHQRASDDPLALCGRIHVRYRDPSEIGPYLTKYLVKQRGLFPKGMRQWSWFRMEKKQICKDISFDTDYTRLFAWMKEKDTFFEVNHLFELHLDIRKPWHRILIAKRFFKSENYEDQMPWLEKMASRRRISEMMGRNPSSFFKMLHVDRQRSLEENRPF